MILKHRFIVIIIVIILLTIAIIIFFKKDKPDSPNEIIEKTIHVKIENGIYIDKFTDDHEYGVYTYDAKIFIPMNQIDSVKDQLRENFIEEIEWKFVPNVARREWWDMDSNSIINRFERVTGYPKKMFHHSPKTHVIWAFICNEESGNYYLYVLY